MKEKIIYEEIYKKGRIKSNNLPTLKHLSNGFSCDKAYLLKAGIVEHNGKRQEFQELRIYLKETV